MRHQPRPHVYLWPALLMAIDGGIAGLAGYVALAMTRLAARRTETRGRRFGAAALAWMTAALAADSLASLALFLSHALGAPADLAVAPAFRLPARMSLLAGAAVLAWLVAHRRR